MTGRRQKRQHATRFVSPTVLWFFAVASVPLTLCAAQLNNDLWYDEAFTVGSFASQPAATIITSYPAPNNHILYTLLLRPFFLFSDAEWSLRSLSFVCAAGTLASTFLLGLRIGGIGVAVCATAALGLNQVFLNYAMQVRGYTLSMLLCPLLILAVSAQSVRRSPMLRGITIVILGAAILYVLPTNAVFLVPIAVTCVLSRLSSDRGPITIEVGIWLLAALLGIACYLPVWDELLAATGNRKPSLTSTAALGRTFFTATLRDQYVLLLAIFVAAPRAMRSNARFGWPMWIVLATLIGTFPATAALRIAPFPRNFVPLVPLISLVLGWAIATTLRWLRGRSANSPASWDAAIGLLVIALISGPPLMSFGERVQKWHRAGGANDPYFVFTARNFRPALVAEFLGNKLRSGDRYICCFSDFDQSNLGYYLTRFGIPYRSAGTSQDRWNALVVAAGRPDWDGIARKYGIEVDVLKAFPLVLDSGHFRVFESTDPIPVLRP